MKKGIILGVLLLAAALIIGSALLTPKTEAPPIENWQLVNQHDLAAMSMQSESYKVGIRKFYQDPSAKNVFGSTLSFAGSDEVILKAWFRCKDETASEIEELSMAVKTKRGKWLIFKNADSRVSLTPEIKDGKMISLDLVVMARDGGKELFRRTLNFSPPLSPCSP